MEPVNLGAVQTPAVKRKLAEKDTGPPPGKPWESGPTWNSEREYPLIAANEAHPMLELLECTINIGLPFAGSPAVLRPLFSPSVSSAPPPMPPGKLPSLGIRTPIPISPDTAFTTAL